MTRSHLTKHALLYAILAAYVLLAILYSLNTPFFEKSDEVYHVAYIKHIADGNGFRNWFKVESRVSDRLLFQLKVTRDHNLPKTYVDARAFTNIDFAENPDASYVPSDQTYVRLQLDYTF